MPSLYWTSQLFQGSLILNSDILCQVLQFKAGNNLGIDLPIRIPQLRSVPALSFISKACASFIWSPFVKLYYHFLN
jgi:hypothetical protein